MQDSKKFTWEFGLNSTDLTNALREIMSAVQAVDNTLKSMGKSVKTTFDGVKDGGKSAINEVEQLGTAINKSFSQINKDIDTINKSVRQADMTKWEKMADNYAVKLSAAQKRLETLKKQSEDLNKTEEQRVEIAKKLADAQEKVNRLEMAQQGAAAFAAQQAAAKQATKAAEETAKDAKEAAEKTAKAAKEAAEETAKAANEVEQLGTAINKSFSKINKDIDTINKSVRQADMTKWEKMADNYAIKLTAAQKRLETLKKQSEDLNKTEEQRVEIAKKLADAQEKVNRLEMAQQGAAGFAAQQAAAKQAAKDSKEAAKETAKAAKEAATEQAKADRERERSAKQAAAEATKSAREITRELERAAKAQAAEISSYEKALTKAFNSVEKDIEGITKSMRQADMSRWEKMADNYAMKLQKAENVLTELKARAEDLNSTEEERIRINQRIADTQEKIVQLSQRQKDAVDFAKQKDNAEGLKRAYGGVRDSLQEIATIGAVVSGALAGVIGSSAREFADFESKLTTFKAVSGATADEVARFKDLSRSMAEFGKTSTEVAGLGVELSKAGLSASEIEKGIKQITLAAVATGEELQSTGETVDAVRSQFGLTADEFDRVSNGLVLAANSSKISITDLAESYKYVGSTAKQTGQTLETMNGILAILGNEGIKGSQAGTGLKNVLLKLADPKVNEALKSINVNATDSNGSIRNLTDVVVDLQKGLSGVNQASKVSFLKKQFGEEALVPLLSLLGKSEKSLRDSEKAMKSWTGTSEKMAKDMNKGLLASFNQMQASVQVLQQVFIEAMAPALTVLVNAVKGAADAFVALPKPLQWIVSNGALVVAGFAAVTTAVLGLAFAANSGIMALGGLSNALVGFLTKAPAVAGGVTTLGGAFTSIGAAGKAIPGVVANIAKAFTGFLSGLAAPLAAFIALAASLYVAWEYNLGGFKDILNNAMIAAKDIFGQIGDSLSGLMGVTQGFGELWSITWEATKDTLYATVAVIDEVLGGLFKTIDVIFRMIFDVIFGNWSSLWETITGISSAGANMVVRMMGSFFSKMQTMFATAFKGLAEIVFGAWDMISDPANAKRGYDRLMAGAELMKKSFSGMGAVIREAWDQTTVAVSANADRLTNKGKAIIDINKKVQAETKAPPKTAAPAAVTGAVPTGTIPVDPKKTKAESDKASREELDRVDKFIEEIKAKYEKLAEEKKLAIENTQDIEDSAQAAFVTMPKMLLESAKITEQAADTTGKCYSAFAKALRKAEENVGILDRTGKVLKGQKSIWADIRQGESASAYMFKSVADRAVQRGILEQYQPKSLKDITPGGIVVFPKNYLPGHGAGHIGTTGEMGVEYSDVTNAVLQKAPQLMQTASFYRYKTDSGSKKQAMKQVSADLIEQMIKELEAGLNNFSGEARERLVKAIEAVRTKGVSELRKLNEEINRANAEIFKRNLENLEKAYDQIEKTITDKIKSITDATAALASEFTDQIAGSTQAGLNQVLKTFDDAEKASGEYISELDKVTAKLKEVQEQSKGKATADQQQQINELLARQADLLKLISEYRQAAGLEDVKLTEEQQKQINADLEKRNKLEKDRAELRQKLAGTTSGSKERQAIIESLKMVDYELSEITRRGIESIGIVGLTAQKEAQKVFDQNYKNNTDALQQTDAWLKKVVSNNDELQNLWAIGPDALQKLIDRLKLTPQQIDQLSKAMEQSDIDTVLKETADQTDRMKSSLSGTVGLIAGVASAFGEVGQTIAAGVRTAGELGSAFMDISKISQDITTKGGIPDLAAIFADPTGMTAVITVVTKAVELLYSSLGALLDLTLNADKKIGEIQDARIRITKEKDIAMRRDLLEIQKESGRATLEQELQLINDEAELRQADIAKRARELQERGRGRSFLGLFSTLEDEKKFRDEANALDKEQFENQRERDKARGEAEKADNERRRSALLAQDAAYYDRQEALAVQTADQLDDLDAQHNRNRYDIYLQFEDDKKTAQQNGVTDFFDLEQTRDAKLKALDADTAKQRLEIQAEAQRTRLEMQFDHQQTLLEIEGETFENSIKLREKARDKEAAMIELEMALYEKGSLEYQRLEQQKSDAVLKANAEIRKSTDEMRLERERQMQDMAIQIRQLQAELSGNAARATREGIAKGFFDLAIEEADAIKDARERFENSQEVINRISEFYGLQREKKSKELFEEGLKATRDAYAADQEKLLARQSAPLQRIIDAEERRIKKLQAQNAELEKANQLIDDRAAKEQAAFDLEDKRKFQAALGGINTQDILRQGIEYLANENIINGGILDRTSRESQTRGAMELLDIQEQQANSNLKLEEISKAQFLNEITRINLLRARLIQEQIADTENEKEKADLQARFADLYVNYQKDQKDAIDERRKADTYANDQMILNNNRLKTEAENTAAVQRAKLEEMKAAYDQNMSSIDMQLTKASMTTSGWLNSLKEIAPTLAAQVQAAVGSITKIREEFSKPITVKVQQSSYSPYGPTNPSNLSSVTTSSMTAGSWVTEAGGITIPYPGYAEGGVIPEGFPNDTGIVRVSSGERILQSAFNRRMENMLNFFEAPGGFSAQSVNINVDVSSDVDLAKLETVFDKHMRQRESLGVRRWGVNSMSRN